MSVSVDEAIETLCLTCSFEELLDNATMVREVRRSFGVSRKEAYVLLRGARIIKRIRAIRHALEARGPALSIH